VIPSEEVVEGEVVLECFHWRGNKSSLLAALVM